MELSSSQQFGPARGKKSYLTSLSRCPGPQGPQTPPETAGTVSRSMIGQHSVTLLASKMGHVTLGYQ